MIPKRWKLSWIPAVMVALAVAACDQSPLGTASDMSPSEEASFAKPTSTTTTYSVVEGDIPVFDEEKVIGAGGGSILVTQGSASFELRVPAGAVKQDTRFRFKSANNGRVQVALHATSLGSTVNNDIGRLGFAVPVQLWLKGAFEPKGGPSAWERYQVVHVMDSGKLVPVTTKIYMSDKTVVGYLKHFSDYALAYP